MSQPTTIEEPQKPCDIEPKQTGEVDACQDVEQSKQTDEVQSDAIKESLTAEPGPMTSPEPSKLFQVDRAKARPESTEKKKEDEKLGIYKALAIKLKKELVKTREELQKLQAEYASVVKELKSKVEELEQTLETERLLHENTNITLEATCKNLKSLLETAVSDLQSLQTEFDDYKTRATKIMQQNNLSVANSNRAFDEDRYKQMKDLNEKQKNQLTSLNSRIETLVNGNKDLERQLKDLKDDVCSTRVHRDELDRARVECNTLTKENEHLNEALRQMKERYQGSDNGIEKQTTSDEHHEAQAGVELPPHSKAQFESDRLSLKQDDENHTNSSASSNSSSNGYVHIKPTAFEIISRTSVLEDAQNQIDDLTKAYLDTVRTNSLLSEQVSTLKDEMRRIQRGRERIESPNNLEYLKNVLIKYLSLDSGQVEQKQRLVPVLSTILKLSPDETQHLTSLTEKGGMTSSFFKL